MPSARGHAKDGKSPAAFPIIPLKDVVEMACLIGRRGGRCRFDELATALNQVRTSGAFRGRTAAGRMFGVTETVGSELVLTDMGRRMAMSPSDVDMLAEAFLTVELYGKLFDRYAADGGKLPAVDVIDADIERLGVPEYRATRARQVFIRSAETAGFFRSGRDRLIRPSGGSIAIGRSTVPERKEPAEVSHAEAELVSASASRSPSSSSLPPLMQALVDRLPAEGERYTRQQREHWLETAKNVLDLVYMDDEPAPSSVASTNMNGCASYSAQTIPTDP